MSTHTYRPPRRSAVARIHPRDTRPRQRSAPEGEDVRRLALLAAIALLVSLLTSAFAGIVVSVVGLAALAAHAAAHRHGS